MDITEVIIFLEQILRTAERTEMPEVAMAIADNIRGLAEHLERKAKRAGILRRTWLPWWGGLDEKAFKDFVRTHLSEAGSDPERFKRSLETVADLKGIRRPKIQMAWVDEVAKEKKP